MGFESNKTWLIGGTSESAEIAKMLSESNLAVLVSVTTTAARSLYADSTEVAVGCMDKLQMKRFCWQNSIKTIVDASHPYAAVVSDQAIAVAREINLPYLRYERQSYQTASSILNRAETIELSSFEQLVAGDYLADQRVLLTVGCKALSQFQSWQHRSTLFARVLPKITSLEVAIAAGFTSDRLIAIRPPLSLATEMALWQQWQISLVVTKASGKAGGEDLKHQAANKLGVPLIVIARPQISYPQTTNNLTEVLIFCRQAISIL
ncbi:MAG: cobalt-precorrin-6A reductase [Cyanobacteria bacterium J06600_6]